MNCTIREADRRLKKLGYVFERQSGSHMIYKHHKSGVSVIVVAPRGLQGGEMKLSTLRRMLKKAELGSGA